MVHKVISVLKYCVWSREELDKVPDGIADTDGDDSQDNKGNQQSIRAR